MALSTRLALVGITAASASLGPGLGAQSLAKRVAAVDGAAQLRFASRPTACGDGQSYIGHLLGPTTRVAGAGQNLDRWNGRPCESGPVRIVATVVAGEVVRIRTFIGPVPPPDARVTDLGTVPAGEAATWLRALVTGAPARVARDAIDPLIAAEGSEPWPLLLGVARDDGRPRDVRRQAAFWLGQEATRRLGLDDIARSDDDEVKEQAVFALSQQPHDVGIPKLVELARGSKNEPVRSRALFWLGQSGDARATALFAELLGLK